MNNKIQLNNEQRSYLIRLKSVVNNRYSQLHVAAGGCPSQYMKDSILFIKKVVSNGYYHKQSAHKIREIAEEYHFLINEQEDEK